MKRSKWLLALLAAALVISAGAGTAYAYFTTYVTAKGGYVLHLSGGTEIEEKVSSWTKHVTIRSKEGSAPVFVRVKAFAAEPLTLDISGENWQKGTDDYWCYEKPLEGGSATSDELLIALLGVPEGAQPGEDFNVAVVYETVPAVFTEDGRPDLAKAWADGPVTVLKGKEVSR